MGEANERYFNFITQILSNLEPIFLDPNQVIQAYGAEVQEALFIKNERVYVGILEKEIDPYSFFAYSRYAYALNLLNSPVGLAESIHGLPS